MPTSPPDPDTVTARARCPIGKTVLRQLVAALLTVLAMSVVTFLATNIKSPQDVARGALGRHATSEQITAFVAAHDLTAALPVRYTRWLGDFVQGDWGTSVVTDRPIQPELVPRLARTVLLVGLSFLVVVPLSIAMGGYLAQRWGSRRDIAATSGLMVLSALPEFVVGVGAILLFSVLIGVLPPESGTAIAFGTPEAKTAAYLLPALTLVLVAAPFLTRLTRASAREGLTAPHTRAATLRGLPRRIVIWDYGMRSCAVPIVSATGLTLIHLLGSTIVVENLFGFPGLGQALVSAVGTGDTVAVQAIAVLTAALFVAISLLTDLLATLFNPQLRSAR
ncbi:MAG: ABC transporter permease [Pseudonocardiaceae bacterium]